MNLALVFSSSTCVLLFYFVLVNRCLFTSFTTHISGCQSAQEHDLMPLKGVTQTFTPITIQQQGNRKC